MPIGLLKLAAYFKSKGFRVKLIKGKPNDLLKFVEIKNFNPDEIWITSLFTYWAKYVRDAVQYYKKLFPNAKVIVGGIYASLLPEDCKKYTGCDEVFVGVHKEAEKYFPAYEELKNNGYSQVDYQIIHTTRGCPRRCAFCGAWKIEPEFTYKKSIKNEIKFKKIIFYDNNLLANPYIENILEELIELKKQKKILWCEAQCGFDGRILEEKPYLAKMLKKAGFWYPRIAWDWHYEEYPRIEKQIEILKEGGYTSKDIYVFMLYNWEIPFEEMEKKRIKCWEWKVQIADCRYRPLKRYEDNYNPRKKSQTSKDYYIHPKWTDAEVRQFRRNVRRQNICVRFNVDVYTAMLEGRKKNEVWDPSEITFPPN